MPRRKFDADMLSAQEKEQEASAAVETHAELEGTEHYKGYPQSKTGRNGK